MEKNLVEVEFCMRTIDLSLVSNQMLKLIDEGVRYLPGLFGGSGPPISQWTGAWFHCVETTPSEVH
jgi:hypothetical protein